MPLESKAGTNPFSLAYKANPLKVLDAIHNFLTDCGYAFVEGHHHGQAMLLLCKVKDDRSLDPIMWTPQIIPGLKIPWRPFKSGDKPAVVVEGPEKDIEVVKSLDHMRLLIR